MNRIFCPDCECDDIQIEDGGNGTIKCLCYECGNEFIVEGEIDEIYIEDLGL